MTDLEHDPMPADLPDRVLGMIRRHTCATKGCHREAVVFPPPACAEHGGLEAEVRP